MTIQTEAIMKDVRGVGQHTFVSTCTIFRIRVPYLAYEIFAFTARCQILTGPSQLTLPKRNVRYLERGQARGMLTILYIVVTNTVIGITRMQKIVLKLYMSPYVKRTDHGPYEQGRGSKSTYAQADHPLVTPGCS